jgi:hypothetical protein
MIRLVSNLDDDTAGISVSPTSGLVTTEAGGTATFTVVLTSEPTGDVMIPVSIPDTTEGTTVTVEVKLKPQNWSNPQVVTVTGVNDFVMDGDIAYTIVLGVATSTDGKYDGMDPSDVSATNQDDDTAGITVSPTSGLVTTEGLGTAQFTVVLTSEPTAEVTVTVTGVNDFVDDGDAAYEIVTAPATSADGNYNGENASDVSVTNVDDDTAGITVSPTSGLETTEGLGTAAFTVVLDTEPTADVTIGLTSSNTDEGDVSPASLTFTTANWSTAQTVTVTGVDDFVDDGDVVYAIVTAEAASTDGKYDVIDPSDVTVTNLDDDTAGITVDPTSGLETTEGLGTAAFTVVLDTEPTADVTLGLTSSNTDEGDVSPASLTFTALTWSVAQTVTVTGADDFVDDGDVVYTIVTAEAVSGDGKYDTLDASDVTVTNLDDDTAGITVDPTSGLVTTEGLGTAQFTVVLDTEPTADVGIGLSSSDTTEGSVSPASLTFTAANWDAPQTVTVTGVDDFEIDGTVAYTITTATATSADAKYNGVDPSDVAVTNQDDDTAGITVDPTSGLVTTEAGGTDTFTVVLTSKPSADVTVGLSSSETAEGTVSPASLTFDSTNWNVAQTVTVAGVNDDVDDDDAAYTIVTASAVSGDTNYNGVDPSDVSATNLDDDTAGITVDPVSGLSTTEAGGTAQFTVVLNTEPTADVAIGLSSSNTDEGTVAPASLTFTTLNWSTPQTVTVTGVNDDVDDDDVVYTIATDPATSGDAKYSGQDASDVSVTNVDDDTAGITVDPTSGLATTEAGGTDTFTVVLDTEPTADVTISLTSSNTDEGTVSPTPVTFTTLNWNAPQTVTVAGVNDDVDDGDVVYTIVTAEAVSTDAKYDVIRY